jgi:hypothetical protein
MEAAIQSLQLKRKEHGSTNHATSCNEPTIHKRWEEGAFARETPASQRLHLPEEGLPSSRNFLFDVARNILTHHHLGILQRDYR